MIFTEMDVLSGRQVLVMIVGVCLFQERCLYAKREMSKIVAVESQEGVVGGRAMQLLRNPTPTLGGHPTPTLDD